MPSNCRFPDWHRGCPHKVKAFRLTCEDDCQFVVCGECKNYALDRWPGGEGFGEELQVSLLGQNQALTPDQAPPMDWAESKPPAGIEEGMEL